jgi:hypothetical protein
VKPVALVARTNPDHPSGVVFFRQYVREVSFIKITIW